MSPRLIATVLAGLSLGAAAQGPKDATAAQPSRDALLESLAEEGGLDANKAKELRSQLEAELAMRTLLEKKAVDQGLDKIPKVAASVVLAKQNALAQAYLDKLELSLAPTEAEVKSDYESSFPSKKLAKVKFAIFTTAEEAAKALAMVASGKETIGELAKQGSDPFVASRGGDFGLVPLDALPDQVAAAIEAAPAKKLPASPIKTSHGHVLYELEAVSVGREKTFDQARPELEKRRRQMMLRSELARLKEEARKPRP